ncbi:MAG: hypothetical protein IJL41_06690 [Clostridia bacterium]|nr:hypothetical protein [Clostridia bacterium]
MSKKLFVILLAVCVAAVALGTFLILRALTRTGADDPVRAVWQYQKAAMLYDADGMLKYSSEYNTAVLADHVPRNTDLKEYLKKQYSSVTSRYAGKKLTYNAEIAGEWSDGDEGYEILFAEYMDRVPDADIPLRFAEVRMTVFSENSKAFEITAYAVQAGGSWYYWKTD